MEIYHRTGVRVVGIGYCGPDTSVDLPIDEAKKLSTWPDWSLTPFPKAEESKPKRKLTKVVNDAQ